jgi:signal transduction histidine kinase
MMSLRWWNLAFGTTIALLVGLSLLAWAPTQTGRAVALLLLGLLVVSYLTLGRPALRTGRFALAFCLILIGLSAGVVACSPNLATVQIIAFPLLWSVIDSTRRSIVANIALAVTIAIGYAAGLGATPASIGQAISIESISLAGSVALGLWISRIAELSHERKRLLEELTASQNEVAALSRDTGMLAERERLAREIHDTIAQDLTGLVMLSQRAQRELGAHETLALLEESARTALAETRALVASSAPVALTSGGIADALQRLAERFGRETSVNVTVSAELPPLDRDTEVVLLRCAQEGLANVRKHAQASTASLSAWSGDGSVALRIADDGTGFDPSAAADGFGLGGMRDRLALVGGTLDVSSSPAGTVLTATLPVRP